MKYIDHKHLPIEPELPTWKERKQGASTVNPKKLHR
jgi:hypothetical protein